MHLNPGRRGFTQVNKTKSQFIPSQSVIVIGTLLMLIWAGFWFRLLYVQRPYFHPDEYLGALMTEGRRLADLLREQDGALNGEQAGLVLTFLGTIASISDPEFADIVLLILQRSRHLEVAEKARTLSRSLLLGAKSRT